jgi:hypothetical protein
MLQANPGLSPREIKSVMMRTATDIVSGQAQDATSGATAKIGFDIATGSGLANAKSALSLV